MLRLPNPQTGRLDRPPRCPYCGSLVLQRWGQVQRTVQDTQQHAASLYRYRCADCQRTFREYPPGVDDTSYSRRIRYLAALVYGLGLSNREVAGIFKKRGINISHTTIWRESQELLRQAAAQDVSGALKRYSMDKQYLPGKSSKLGIVIGVDWGDGQYDILGTVDEFNPRVLKSWLNYLLKDIGIEILQHGTSILSQ